MATAAVAEQKKPKVDLREDAFLGADPKSGANGPTIEAGVEYTDTHFVVRIPLESMTYANSRPTTSPTRRMFAVRGDADPKEGIPGLIGLSNGANLSVTFGNPTLNLFFSKSKA
jgi:hypothetical protein